MNFKKIFYMLYPMHIPRNFLQYLIGAVMFYTFFGEISWQNVVLGGIAFTIFYQFTYAFNDFIDHKTDIEDKNIMKKKLALKYPLHAGMVKVDELMPFSLILLILGIMLSAFVGITFLYAQLLLLIFTFIHSNPFIKLKSFSLLLYTNMIIIQFMKFSLGWFSHGSTQNLFPYWLFILLASIYVWGYRYYKSHFLQPLKGSNITDLFINFILILSFVVSLFLYDMPFPLIFSLLICGSIIYSYFGRLKSLNEKMQKGIMFIEIFYLIVILSFISVRLFPMVFDINHDLNSILKDGVYLVKILFNVN